MKRIAQLVLLLSIPLVSGCITGARIEQMEPPPVQPLSQDLPFYGSVGIDSVSGGEETNPLWISKISDDAYRDTLRLALRDAGALHEGPGVPKYLLRVTLDEVDQPWGGIDMTVTTKVTYIMKISSNDQTIFTKQIVAPYTAKFGDQMIGAYRLRDANEGSAKENIKLFIEYLQGE